VQGKRYLIKNLLSPRELVIRKGVIPLDRLHYIVKELIKLMQQLNKLAIEIISLIGWILILIKLFE